MTRIARASGRIAVPVFARFPDDPADRGTDRTEPDRAPHGGGKVVAAKLSLERAFPAKHLDIGGLRPVRHVLVIEPRPSAQRLLLRNVYFDTCAGIECFFELIEVHDILLASEMASGVNGVGPGHVFEETKRNIDALDLSEGGQDPRHLKGMPGVELLRPPKRSAIQVDAVANADAPHPARVRRRAGYVPASLRRPRRPSGCWTARRRCPARRKAA
ncbi:hypothetical protein SAMN05444340_11284 [Citreimonas salinaria]|uniref:Uncharacterized protein n=1 Tax=Citreimonas salinaria TaxID=321339 RepID=A0A1H3LDN8_9RHOB|nr:hypothetical protein SAMN05444340_11284 [Citreimonas salinaria]